ncbi:MAG: hypothetical protein OEZ23_09550, partial [Gammaproteobacteria bacterium]|nr:hypothetical protein [Gammaproteobacteria bacterium]
GVQTIGSQGMIHGGIKYSLNASLTGASESVSSMPEFWRQCLSGNNADNEPDLSDVKLLSDSYYLFSDSSLSSRLTTFLGSKLVRGRVTQIAPANYPEVFSSPEFKGRLYLLQDMVLDTASLTRSLVKGLASRIIRALARPVMNDEGAVSHLSLSENADSSEIVRVKAAFYIFTAGLGNEIFIKHTGVKGIKTQRRPLHQVIIKSDRLPPIFAHAISLTTASSPRVTITSHTSKTGQTIWYLGGELAETGVNRSEKEQIAFSRKELCRIMPWIDFSASEWSTLRIDRAEPSVSGLLRPEKPVVFGYANMMFCWPVKLTMAPLLGQMVCQQLEANLETDSSSEIHLPETNLRFPEWAEFPWDAL